VPILMKQVLLLLQISVKRLFLRADSRQIYICRISLLTTPFSRHVPLSSQTEIKRERWNIELVKIFYF
jgi:hypothetical protein